MEVLAAGFMLMALGVFTIRYVKLSTAIKEEDEIAWNVISAPSGAFPGMSASLGLFHWLLNQGYDHTESHRVKTEAKRALIRARVSKYLLLTGIFTLSIGFPVSLIVA